MLPNDISKRTVNTVSHKFTHKYPNVNSVLCIVYSYNTLHRHKNIINIHRIDKSHWKERLLSILCMYIWGLRLADHSSKQSYRLWVDQETEKESRAREDCRANQEEEEEEEEEYMRISVMAWNLLILPISRRYF
jgi:hypothetical protein